MNCASCGSQVQQDDSFCIQCGAALPISAPPSESSATQAAATPTVYGGRAPDLGGQPKTGAPLPLPPSTSEVTRVGKPAWTPSPEKQPASSGRWLTLAALLLVLFGLAAAGGFFLQRTVLQKDQPAETTTAQSALDQPPGVPAAIDDGQPEATPPAADPNTAEPSAGPGAPGGGADQTSPPAGGGASGGAGNASLGKADSKSSPGPSKSIAQAGSSVAASPPQASPPQSAAPTGQTAESGSAPPQRPSGTGAIPPPEAAAEPPPPNSGQPPQPQPANPSEIAAAGAPGTADTPAQPPQRTPVFDPARQPQRPRPTPQNPNPGTAAPPALKKPPPPPAPQERREGIIYWTGRLTKNQVIVIEKDEASIGNADGSLPAQPVDVWLPSPAVVLVERPNEGNNWSRLSFRCVQSTNRNVTLNIQWERLP